MSSFHGEGTRPKIMDFLLDQFNDSDDDKLDEFREVCRRVQEALALLGGYISLLRTMHTDFDPAGTVARATDFRKAAMDVLRKLGAKAHLCEDHGISFLELLHGLGKYTEDFMEQEHQYGVLDALRTRGLRNLLRKAVSKSRWEAASRKSAVAMAMNYVQEKSKCKRSRSQESAAEKASAERHQARDAALAAYHYEKEPLQTLQACETEQVAAEESS